jgi:hypothetical protein
VRPSVVASRASSSASRPGRAPILARVEAAIYARGAAPALGRLSRSVRSRDAGARARAGVEIVRIDHDVLGVSARALRSARKLRAPRALLVLRRNAAEAVDVLELPWAQALHLLESSERPLPPAHFAMEETTLAELARAGVLVPGAYRA